MLETAKLYKRVVPVKAIQITRRFSVESRNGVIETGNPGDYLLEDTLVPGDLWIVRRNVFEAEFEPASGKGPSQPEPKSSDKRQTRPNMISPESL